MKVQSDGASPDDVILEVHGLTKVFGSGPTAVRAVDGVDLDARAGEIVLIMGPSGSGKTTLLTMIGGLLKPTSGAVRINGYDTTAMKESELTQVRRHQVGFVFQTFNLLESLSAVENVEVAMNMAGVRGRDARSRAVTLLQERGLGHRLGFGTRQLSGGEKQRVSIARALANEPRLILADEPTANLDSKHGHDTLTHLQALAKEEGRTVIIVSHDQRVSVIADRVMWLEDGRFKDASRLVTDPVCGMQVEVERARASLDHEGHTYYFCSRGCSWEFKGDPLAFVGDKAEEAEQPSP